MNPEGLAARMSVIGGAMPQRILVVDDDEMERTLIGDRLESAGYGVTRATNGQEALEWLQREWFPVVITDWRMPVMDGIAFTEALRAQGNDETYVIMLTLRESSMDYERGYRSGVNDYLTKRLPDAELFARINAAFNTLALRRSLAHAQRALAASPLDPRSGAFCGKESMAKLQSEIIRAQRYGRMVSVMTMGVRCADPGREPEAALMTVVRTVQATVRSHVDWVGRLDVAGDVFAIVLPEAGTAALVPIIRRLRGALHELHQGPLKTAGLHVDFGAASFQPAADLNHALSAADLIEVAEKCRGCPGFKGPVQLAAVQCSVGNGAAIVCRHGYVVDDQCTLKL